MHAAYSANGEGLAIGAESQSAAIAMGTNDDLWFTGASRFE